MEKADLGKKIREARLKKGYTQQALAEKADVAEMYISQIERGLKMPSMNLFIKIITALDIYLPITFSVMRFLPVRIMYIASSRKSWIPLHPNSAEPQWRSWTHTSAHCKVISIPKGGTFRVSFSLFFDTTHCDSFRYNHHSIIRTDSFRT